MIVDKRSKNFGRKIADRQVIIKVLICSLSERIRSKIIKAQHPKTQEWGWQGVGEISVRSEPEPLPNPHPNPVRRQKAFHGASLAADRNPWKRQDYMEVEINTQILTFSLQMTPFPSGWGNWGGGLSVENNFWGSSNKMAWFLPHHPGPPAPKCTVLSFVLTCTSLLRPWKPVATRHVKLASNRRDRGERTWR